MVLHRVQADVVRGAHPEVDGVLDVAEAAGGGELLVRLGELLELRVAREVEEGPALPRVGERGAGEALLDGELLPGVEELTGLDIDILAEGGGVLTGEVWVVVFGAVGEGAGDEVEVLVVGDDRGGAEGRGEVGEAVAREGDDHGGEAAIAGAAGEGGDAGGLDGAVEGVVPGGEALVVGAIAGAVDVEEGDDEARALLVAADAAGRLDVLRDAEVAEGYARTTITGRPLGVRASSRAVRSAMRGRPERRSKMTSQPVSRPRPAR